MLTDRPVVGFDLDMTLVDSSPGIVATLTAVLAEQGVTVTADQIWPWIGLPLRDTVQGLAPQADGEVVVAAYRRLYRERGARLTTLLPGAAAAVTAVRAAGGRVLVISAKGLPGVLEVLRVVGLDGPDLAPDVVAGDLFAGAKGVRLKQEDAQAYVGDHPGDVEAARVAGALAVGVATGPRTADELAAAGADVVLTDLTAFPDWLAGQLTTPDGAS